MHERFQAGTSLKKFKFFATKGHRMHHNSTAHLQHSWHDSFNNLKKFLYSHEEPIDNMVEKTTETGAIIIVAVFVYMIILIFNTLNYANQAYDNGLTHLIYNTLHDLMYSALQGFV